MISYFLGANSPHGFYSLYDELIDRSDAAAVYILKGGPGCGKSTLLKKVGAAAQEAGYPVEYIRCSGDPDSMDGIVLPAQKTAIVDGTAPHVVEPQLPGAVDHYIDLGLCYDGTSLAGLRGELTEAMKGYKTCYDRAYRCLAAACDTDAACRSILVSKALNEKISKRVKGIISRELHPAGKESGRVTRRFLSAVSCKGLVCQWETIQEQCRKLYVLEDSHAFAHLFLLPLMTAASAAGYNVIACSSPMAPERLEHLLIPDLALAFVSSTPSLPYPGKAHRHIRLDAMPDADLLRQNRQRLRFSRKISAALVQESVHCLEEAKLMHDKLEALYNPHVDFDRVHAIADELIESLGLK